MSQPQEIELKFSCAPDCLSAVLAAAPAGDDESGELISVYFDTPDQALQKAGASLRVRESGGRRVQTLKRGAGLMREEHEKAIAGLSPEPDMGPLRELLPEGDVSALQPAFNVRITRRQRLIRYQGAEIELALDHGEVADGPRTSPISEVELELKSGSPAALFALARDLAQAAPLYLSYDSKSDRGRALTGTAPAGAKSNRAPKLPKRASVAVAFQATARAALAQIAGAAATLRERPDAEAVHQLRVAVRRFRSALSSFRLVVADHDTDRIKAELRWLGSAFNEARDLDVLEQTLSGEDEPAGRALADALGDAQSAARTKAHDAVASLRFRTLMVDVAGWVETGAWQFGRPAQQPARAFARRALDRRLRKVTTGRKALIRGDDAARHELRIQAKKLRYTAEAFAGLFPARRVKPFIARLKTLQDSLGALNDLVVAEPLIGRLRLEPEAAFAAGKRLGLKTSEQESLLGEAGAVIRRLKSKTPFWR